VDAPGVLLVVTPGDAGAADCAEAMAVAPNKEAVTRAMAASFDRMRIFPSWINDAGVKLATGICVPDRKVTQT
jgi:hypothetical protein